MFKDSGSKLKVLAYWEFGLIMAMVVIFAFFEFFNGQIALSILIVLVSPFVAFIPAATTYAIGEMYEKVMYDKTVTFYKKQDGSIEEKVVVTPSKEETSKVPEYDKILKLKQFQQSQLKSKKPKKENDKYLETDL